MTYPQYCSVHALCRCVLLTSRRCYDCIMPEHQSLDTDLMQEVQRSGKAGETLQRWIDVSQQLHYADCQTAGQLDKSKC